MYLKKKLGIFGGNCNMVPLHSHSTGELLLTHLDHAILLWIDRTTKNIKQNAESVTQD